MMRLRLAISLLVLGAAAAAGAGQRRAAEAERLANGSLAFVACLDVNPVFSENGVVNADAPQECNCAVDRLLAEGSLAGLPRIDRTTAGPLLEAQIAACRRGDPPAGGKLPAGEAPVAGAPDLAAGDALDAAIEAADALEAAVQGKPEPEPGAEAESEAAFAMPSWPEGFEIPRWFRGAIAGVALLIVVLFGFARLRGRSGRDDLMGPPPSMRPGPRDRMRPPR